MQLTTATLASLLLISSSACGSGQAAPAGPAGKESAQKAPAENTPGTQQEQKPPQQAPTEQKPLEAKWPVKDSAAGEDIPGVVAKGTPIYKWSEGHAFTEGPACAPDGTMYFTDIPNNQVLRIDPTGATVVLKDSKGMNGLFFSKDGTLFGCQAATQSLVAIDLAKGETRVVSGKRADGAPLGKLNDLVLDRTGGIWFTAPVIGRKREGNAPDAVYYAPVEGGDAIEVLRSDKVVAPNGVHLSPDSKTLYVVPYLSLEIMAYPIEGPGKLGEGKVFYKIPGGTRETIGGDGLTVDTRGNVFVTLPARAAVFVLSPEGKPLGMIRFPERPSNCALGGKDGRTLFVTAQKGVYSIDVEGARSR